MIRLKIISALCGVILGCLIFLGMDCACNQNQMEKAVIASLQLQIINLDGRVLALEKQYDDTTRLHAVLKAGK